MADTGSGSITLDGSIQRVFWLNGASNLNARTQYIQLDIAGVTNPNNPRRLCQCWVAVSKAPGVQPTGISDSRVAKYVELWLPSAFIWNGFTFGLAGLGDVLWVKARTDAIGKTLSYFWKNNN